jgi:hypothetical protein
VLVVEVMLIVQAQQILETVALVVEVVVLALGLEEVVLCVFVTLILTQMRQAQQAHLHLQIQADSKLILGQEAGA